MKDKLPFKPRIIFVNGPPRSGKDTLAKLLRDFIADGTTFDPVISKFTEPMDEIMREAWDSCYLSEKHEFYEIREKLKDQPVMHAGSVPRQALIDLSEKWFKPYFGPTIFGRLAASRVNTYPDNSVFIFSDSGFYQEAYGLLGSIEHLGSDDMVVIQIHRDGCTFEGDSRAWLDLQEFDIPLIYLNNNGTLAEFSSVCYNLFHDLFIEKPDQIPVIASDETNTSFGSSPLDTAGPVTDVPCSGEDDTANQSHCGSDSGKGNEHLNIQTS